MSEIKGGVGSSISGKVKNLLKAKNIKKLNTSKKWDFVKAKVNRASGIGFLTPKASIAFI